MGKTINELSVKLFFAVIVLIVVSVMLSGALDIGPYAEFLSFDVSPADEATTRKIFKVGAIRNATGG